MIARRLVQADARLKSASLSDMQGRVLFHTDEPFGPALPDSAAAELQRGVIVARSRDPEKFIGQPATDALLAGIAAGRTVLRADTKDGTEVIAAAASVAGSGWHVAVGRPLAAIGPWSIAALLATLVLRFAFQGEAILKRPLVIAMLAVAAAITLFGFESGASPATVVGVRIEVPLMLLVVRWVNRSKGWYEAGAKT